MNQKYAWILFLDKGRFGTYGAFKDKLEAEKARKSHFDDKQKTGILMMPFKEPSMVVDMVFDVLSALREMDLINDEFGEAIG